jgi:hypothetical protein
MEGEGSMPGLDWIDHQFGATAIPVNNYSPEALRAADAFMAALPAVRAAMLAAYKAVAEFGLNTLGEACDIMSDLQNDAQEQVEREHGLSAPRLVATGTPQDAARLAAAGFGQEKLVDMVDLAGKLCMGPDYTRKAVGE